MYGKLIKNYSEYNIHKVFDEDFLTNKSNFDIGYELKDKDSIVGYCKIEYTPFKMEMISELLELKRKELEYLESQFAEINRTYTTDETIEKDYQDYLRLKTEIDKLEIFLKRDEMEKRLSYLKRQKEIDQINDKEIGKIDTEIFDLNDKLGKYPLLYENIVDIITNNINKLKTLKRKEVIYYDENKNIDYTETFQYKNEDSLTPEETGISKLTNSKGKTIGYRYYRNGINNNFNNNDFVTIVEGPDGQYHPIQSTGNYEDDLEIIHSIFRENYKEEIGYGISGNRQKTLGISAIAKKYNESIYVFSPGEQLKDDYYLTRKDRKRSIVKDSTTEEKKIHTPTCFNFDGNTYKIETGEQITLSKFNSILTEKKILNNKKLALFPLSFASHATLYLIDPKDNPTKQYLIDFSLGHCEKDINGIGVNANEDYFGSEFEKIILLNKFPMQINGTCSFYADAILNVITNPINNYDNIENLLKDCDNGTIWLKVVAEMGKTFDLNQEYPTVKEFSDVAEALDPSNTNKYIVFNKNGTFFGISKECYNNKFIDMETLIKCLQINQRNNKFGVVYDINGIPLEQKLSKQIELQKEIIKAQRMMYLLNKCTRQFSVFEKILNKKIEKGKLSRKEDCLDYNYYSKSNLIYKDSKERYKDNLDNFIKHLSHIEVERLEEGIQELLNEVPNIDNIRKVIDDESYKTFERSTKTFLEKIKFSIVDSINDELLEDPELYNALEQLEILDESQSLKVIKSKEKTKVKQPNNVKQVRKLKSLDRQKTFTEREIIRKQQQKYTKEKIIHNMTY